MHTNPIQRGMLVLGFAAILAAPLSADVVETKNGARIVGKVTKIDGGAVTVTTDFAGAVTIKQSEITGITTDGPVAVRLASGTRLEGKISSSAGALQIAGADGSISTTVDKVAASWAAGGKDPAIAALERGWAYEAAVDVAGKTGNKEQLGTGFSFVLISRNLDNVAYRAGVGTAAVTGFLLVWVTLAVGIIGPETHPANVLYGGVLAIAALGAGASRFRPHGLSYTMFATAFAQLMVPVVAWLVWRPILDDPPGMGGVFLLNAVFALLFAASGMMFRRVARKQGNP